MISSISRFLAKRPKLVAADYLKLGETNVLKDTVFPFYTYNPTGKPGDGILRTSRLIENMEHVSADILTKKKLISVGFLLDIKHVKPTMFGKTVKYDTEIVGLKGNKITFKTTARDDYDGTIYGYGTHIRAIIGTE